MSDVGYEGIELSESQGPQTQRSSFSVAQTCEYLGLLLLFVLGLWFIAWAPLAGGTRIPGDLGDARLNIYFLEHVFRWVTGRDPSLWTAPFFHGYPYTFAFSGNHLGSFPFYFLWRIVGFDRESAFQGWYILNFVLNFAVAAYVLLKMRLAPLAAGAGAFIFTFGVPVLAQVHHCQLLYRFCVPLACFCLLKFVDTRSIWQLWGVSVWFVGQMCIEIYTGVFLSFLLVAMAAAIAWRERGEGARAVLLFWPKLIADAWRATSKRSRIWSLAGTVGVIALLVSVLWPYVFVVHLYGFRRTWPQIEPMMPRLQSYLLCDGSSIWRSFSARFKNVPMRHEQEMFIGGGALILAAIGSLWKRTPYRAIAVVNATALLLIVFATLYMGPHSRYTLYRLLANLPGFSAIRAVSRIIVVMLWPVGVLAALAIDSIWRSGRVLLRVVGCLLLAFVFLESLSLNQPSYSKAEGDRRLTLLRNGLPKILPHSPILASPEGDSTIYANVDAMLLSHYANVDAMLLSQSLGWPTLNGYSGNDPTDWHGITRCGLLHKTIARSLAFTGELTKANCEVQFRRVVPVGFDDCRPELSEVAPSFSEWSGPLPEATLKAVRLRVIDVLPADENSVRVRVEISNHGRQVLPSLYKGPKAFYLSERLVDARTNAALSGFDVREELDADVLPEGKLIEEVRLPVARDGRFFVEVSAAQELVSWIDDRGSSPVRSAQVVEVLGGAVKKVD